MKSSTQRILAKEFLIAMGIVVVVLLSIAAMFARNPILNKQVKAMAGDVRAITDTIHKLRLAVATWTPTAKDTGEAAWTPPPEAVPVKDAPLTSGKQTTWKPPFDAVPVTNAGQPENFPPASQSHTPSVAEFDAAPAFPSTPTLAAMADSSLAAKKLLSATKVYEMAEREGEISLLTSKRDGMLSSMQDKVNAMLSPEEILSIGGWVALGLVICAYPIRFLFLGTRWAIMTLAMDKSSTGPQ